jgi:hypothetical protein
MLFDVRAALPAVKSHLIPVQKGYSFGFGLCTLRQYGVRKNQHLEKCSPLMLKEFGLPKNLFGNRLLLPTLTSQSFPPQPP